MTISKDSVVVAVKSQVSCQLDAETVVLHYDKGLYFGLNEVGTLIWNQVQRPRKVQEIRDAILREYEVSNEQCERDLFTLLRQLSEEGLVEVRDAAA
jgi:coenzyme PQQ synthesis protein D (PqqD)